jgi:hypothetical protein
MKETPPAEATPPVEAPAPEEPAPVAAATVKPETPTPVVGTVTAGAARVVDGQNPDPLKNFEVDALVLGVGDKYATFVSADVPGLDRSVHDAVAAKLAAAGSKVDPQALLIGATGANTGWRKGVLQGTLVEALFGKYDEKSFNDMVDSITQAVVAAEAALAPAEYLTAETEAPEFHKPIEGASPTLDSTLGVLLAQDHTGAPIGMIVNYAIHPPVEFGAEPLNGRGVAGRIAEKLRAGTRADLPLVFFNGAAEDLTANLGDTAEAKAASIEKLGALAMDGLKGATPKRESSLAAVTWEATLPKSLLGDVLRPTALVTEVQLSGDRFITMPGIPAAQIGMLLRVKSLSTGAGQTFLCSLTNDFQGVHTGVSEFFGDNQRAQMSFHGPLMIKWYADNLVLGADDPEAWKMAPELADRATAYDAGKALGEKKKAEIETAWAAAEVGLAKLVPMLLKLRASVKVLPPEVDALINATPQEKLVAVGRQGAATYLRSEAADYTPEQRVMLMGVAEAVALPFDAVLLLDALSAQDKLPQEITAILFIVGLKGFKILE